MAAVFAVCLRRELVGLTSDQAQLAAGFTRTQDFALCSPDLGMARAEQLLPGRRFAPPILKVVGLRFRGPVLAPEHPLRLPGFDLK